MASIGQFIKILRENKNYSQRKLSYVSKVSNATINRIESGIEKPRPETLKKLSSHLGVSYEELLKIAGYLNERPFTIDDLKLIRQQKNLSFSELSEDILKKTGIRISSEVLEKLENSERDPQAKDLYSLEGRSREALESYFCENIKDGTYVTNTAADIIEKFKASDPLSHIEDKELKKWISDPENTEYLVFAKKVSDLKADPDFILYLLEEFVGRIFKKDKKTRK